jgi:rare lipoprotein A
LLGALNLSGCGLLRDFRAVPLPAPGRSERVEATESRSEPLSKYGNPESYVVNGKRYYTLRSARGFTERGVASWYGNPFHGRRTSSGEIYDMYRMTAAHKQLPLPTYVEVRNLDNGRTATLRVNDRGPFHDNRVIDLSYAAALKLGVVQHGTAFVEVRAVQAAELPGTAPLPPSAGAATHPAGPGQARGQFIQIGAFAERANAERLRTRVAAVVREEVGIRPFASNGRTLYRVQLGPLRNVAAADDAVTALRGIGVHDHRFTSN